MPINIEDTLIRVLVDTQKGVQDVKKLNQELKDTGKQSKLSGKDLLKMAGAFGGASAAIDLVVKAIGSYIAYLKEAETAYITMGREQVGALDDAIVAYDRLDEAQVRSMEIQGKAHAEWLSAHRVRRAARIEETNLVLGLTDAQNEEWRQANRGLTTLNSAFESRLDFARRLAKEEAERLDRIDAQKEYERILSGESQAAKDLLAAKILLSEEQERLNELNSNDAMMATQAAIDREEEAAAEKLRIAFEYNQALEGYRAEAHQAELDRIAEEIEARKEAAYEMVNLMQSGLSAIGDLVDTRYQNEADAAERGSEAQQEALTKQFNANKAFSIADALINTAVAITKVLSQAGIFAGPLAVLTGALGAAQVAAIAASKPPAFATGTSPSGFTVPPGYNNDTFPIMASSGETVNVERAGNSESGQLVNNIINIDGYQFGQVITRLTKSGKATISQRAIIA